MEKKVFRSKISLLFVPFFGALMGFGWFTSKISGNYTNLVYKLSYLYR